MAEKKPKSNNVSCDIELDPNVLQPRFFEELLGCLEDPVFVKNDRHQWIFANDAFKRLIGTDDIIGRTDSELFPPEQVAEFYQGDDQVISLQVSFTREEQIGDDCYALVKKIPIDLPDGSPGLFGIIFDISEYRKVQLEVERLRITKEQSLTDPLTGLANRRHLDAFYAELLNRCRIDRQPFGVLHIDLDHFKEINDTKGHAVGDAVLVHVAHVLRNQIRGSDFIARIGGDEFVVVVEHANQSTLENLAQRLVDAFAKPQRLDNEWCKLSISLGIALDENGCSELTQMLKSADLALYRAKQNGRGRYENFSASLLREHEELIQHRNALRRGLAENQFFPVYQPQFDTATLRIVGVEALARWQHPEQGILAPGAFLDLANAESCLADLDRHILLRAVEDARALDAMGLTLPTLSINLSAQSLGTREFVQQIERLGSLPTTLCFELVESILLDELDCVVAKNLDQLRALGVHFDIDDFGSGHSSLLGMLEARPDRIKIDRRLIIPMAESNKYYELVRSIIHIANSLDMKTVAEGVETPGHRDLLLQLGCHCIQGFGYARPMPFDALQRFLAASRVSAQHSIARAH